MSEPRAIRRQRSVKEVGMRKYLLEERKEDGKGYCCGGRGRKMWSEGGERMRFVGRGWRLREKKLRLGSLAQRSGAGPPSSRQVVTAANTQRRGSATARHAEFRAAPRALDIH
jgi:hypothetical protein